jgi:predicted Zn-dependent protease
LNQLQSVYGYTNDVSLKGLSALAESLSKSFKGPRQVEVTAIKKVRVKNLSPIEEPFTAVPTGEKIALLKDASKIIQGHDPRIVRVQTSMMDTFKQITIFNSKGKEFHDERMRAGWASSPSPPKTARSRLPSKDRAPKPVSNTSPRKSIIRKKP